MHWKLSLVSVNRDADIHAIFLGIVPTCALPNPLAIKVPPPNQTIFLRVIEDKLAENLKEFSVGHSAGNSMHTNLSVNMK
jgi:hypothetical protein